MNGRGEAEGERHGRWLGNDREWTDLLLCKLAQGPVGAYVVGVHMNMIANMTWWGLKVILVCILAHGLLGILHAISEEPVDFVKVDSPVPGT